METARLNHQFELIPNRATGYDNTSNRIWRAEFASPTQSFSAGGLVGSVLEAGIPGVPDYGWFADNQGGGRKFGLIRELSIKI